MKNKTLTEKRFFTGELTLNYAESPNRGHPLVMLHGGTDNWQTFKPILNEMAERYHLYLPDLRGHGLSDRAQSYWLKDEASDIIQFITMIGKPVYLLGHSLGSLVALYVAARMPETVIKLVIEDPPFFGTSDERFNQSNRRAVFMDKLQRIEKSPSADILAKQLQAQSGLSNIQSEHLARAYRQLDPNALRAFIERRNLSGYDYVNDLQQLRCPTLLLRADPTVRSRPRRSLVD